MALKAVGRRPGGRHLPSSKKRGRHHTYKCMVDGREHDRDDLLVKKIVYMEMGSGARTVRSRVIGWICLHHVESDPDYNREPWIDAPGHAPTED